MIRAVEPGGAIVADERPPRFKSAGLVVAFGPVWFALAMAIVAPGFADPLLDQSVAFAGLPMGLVMAAAAGLLTVLGAVTVRGARSRLGLLVPIVLFTLPAFVLLILGPGFLLFLRNAG